MSDNVLNPALYTALKRLFGRVRVSCRGERMKWRRAVDKHGQPAIDVERMGEQYVVDCPFCGDQRNRLEIGYGWLTQPDKRCPTISHALKCYNESCKDPYSVEFRMKVLKAGADNADVAMLIAAKREVPEPPPVRLPNGLIPLDQLADDHPARLFLARQYNGLSPIYLAQAYGVSYASEYDDRYRLAQGRIIFPITEGEQLLGWQGRTIDPNEKDRRWLLCPGFRKNFYNGYRINPHAVPIICEGITNAITCGPNGTAIFGKTLDDARARQFAAKWRTAIIALDPDTFVPDPDMKNRVFALELKTLLDRYCKSPTVLLPWPKHLLELARRKHAGEIAKVPDAADLGMVEMHRLIEQVPATHRSLM